MGSPPRDVGPTHDSAGADPAADTKTTFDSKTTASGGWQQDNLSHLLSMALLTFLLLGTLYLLRHDNTQIGLASRSIGDMQRTIRELEDQVTYLKSNPPCQKVGGSFQSLQSQAGELEKRVQQATGRVKQLQAELATSTKGKEELGELVAKLTREKHVLTKRLGSSPSLH